MTVVQRCARAAFVLAGVAVNAAAQTAASGAGATYPAKTVRLIASQAPGGGVDAVARIVSARLGEAVGQSVIVDNRAGANGSLAGEITAKSPPDGYTVLLGAVGNMAINTYFIKNMTYEPLQDLVAVTLAVTGGNVLVVHPSVPAKTTQELIALARAKPGALAYGSSGVGGSGHLSAALFQSLTQTRLLHVPYKGGGPAIVDLIAGQVQLSFASLPSTVTSINAGRLRALAVSTPKRAPLFPHLPTLSESAVPGYEAQSWYGFAVRAKTPRDIIARLNKEIVQILNRPDAIEAVRKQGLEVWVSTPEFFTGYVKSEYEKWGRIIKEIGITAN